MQIRDLLIKTISNTYTAFPNAFSIPMSDRIAQIDSILTKDFSTELQNLFSTNSIPVKFQENFDFWIIRSQKEIELQLSYFFEIYYPNYQLAPIHRYSKNDATHFPPATLLLEDYNVYWTNIPVQCFIHRDLAAFLHIELELFLIKEKFADFASIEPKGNLPLVIQLGLNEGLKQVFKQIGFRLIEILVELENEKKLYWEKIPKPKSTHYCLSIKYIPVELYSKIIENREQLEDWKNWLPAEDLISLIDPILQKRKVISSGDVEQFFNQHPYLPVDTRYFPPNFLARITKTIPDLENKINGLLFKGENWHILKGLLPDYSNRCLCIYIDPPYNTGNEGFLYNDKMPHYAWLVMMQNRLELARELLHPDGVLYCSIDDNEQVYLKMLLDSIFGSNMPNIIWHKKTQPSFLTKELIPVTEYILAAKKSSTLLPLWGSFGDKEKLTELINISNQVSIRKFKADSVIFANGWTGELSPGWYGKDKLQVELLTPLQILNGKANQDFSLRSRFKWQQDRIDQEVQIGGIIHIKSTNSLRPTIARHYDEEIVRAPTTLLSKKVDEFPTNTDANREMKDFFGISPFDYPKPTALIRYLIATVTYYQQDYVLDFFGGSGTTAQAVIEQNEFDGKHRHYILIEREEHFDSVLVPRIKKVMFSKNWKDGIPQDPEGHYQIIKIVDLS
jgi:adenine-specific DNA-methyltransferase